MPNVPTSICGAHVARSISAPSGGVSPGTSADCAATVIIPLPRRGHQCRQEVGGRKSRDIMHSFAVPQEAGPTDFGF
jgi:hypothetical protein